MNKKASNHSQADISFQEEMKNVDPLKQDKITGWKKRPTPLPLQHAIMEDKPQAYDTHYLSTVQTGDELNFCRAGLQKRTFQALRRGQLTLDVELDLHGMTAKTAQLELEAFFKDCQRFRYKCLLIIHGKGFGSQDKQPVLKRLVDTWLRDQDNVLAFCSATSREGGTGAAYVLLKNTWSAKK